MFCVGGIQLNVADPSTTACAEFVAAVVAEFVPLPPAEEDVDVPPVMVPDTVWELPLGAELTVAVD